MTIRFKTYFNEDTSAKLAALGDLTRGVNLRRRGKIYNVKVLQTKEDYPTLIFRVYTKTNLYIFNQGVGRQKVPKSITIGHRISLLASGKGLLYTATPDKEADTPMFQGNLNKKARNFFRSHEELRPLLPTVEEEEDQDEPESPGGGSWSRNEKIALFLITALAFSAVGIVAHRMRKGGGQNCPWMIFQTPTSILPSKPITPKCDLYTLFSNRQAFEDFQAKRYDFKLPSREDPRNWWNKPKAA